jgi:uncharacterized protein (TIGR02231 family)
MKRAFIIFFLMAGIAGHGQVEKTVDSRITGVTVFLNRAQVTRVLQTRVDAGKTNIIVSGLTANLDPQSIQVTGKGNITLIGISHQQNFIHEFNMPSQLRMLRDSVELLKGIILLEQNQREILNKEEQLILSNQKIGGDNQNLSAAELKAMADFYRSRLTDIYTQRTRQDDKIRKLNDRSSKLQQQFREKNDLYSRNTSEIVISVSSDNSSAVELEVDYLVNNAGWTPIYDLRAIDTKKPVQLAYKANVFQSTGEEWKNVNLTLSTQNPNLGGVKPELDPWYVDFRNYYPTKSKGVGAVHRAPAPAMAEEKEILESPVQIQTISDFTTSVQTSVSTEFQIKLPYSVGSTGKPTLVDIANHSLNADYIYSVAPKMDPDAFLMARITGWGELNLLPGEANVFFEGTYVTKTIIDPSNIMDTLAISLGRDKRIVVKREKMKDFTTRKAMGGTQRDSFAYEISIRNTKAEAVKIVVEDQVPVSQNSQIEVALQDAGGARYTAASGKLLWELELKSQETKKLVYKFEVKYPKDKVLSNL